MNPYFCLFPLSPPFCCASFFSFFFPPCSYTVILKAVGGEIGSASALAPKLGPLGLSPKKVGEDIQKATLEWKGIKVMVKLSVVNRVVRQLIPSTLPSSIKCLYDPLSSFVSCRLLGYSYHHPNCFFYDLKGIKRASS